MAVNPLAQELNTIIEKDCPIVHGLLSDLGKKLFFPKGILPQSAEAKVKATRYNATIGIALEDGEAMHLECVHKYLNGISPAEAYPYAPSTGAANLRKAWAQKQVDETPSLAGHEVSLPIVTNALTHGLSLAGELFISPGDEVLLPNQLWGNYRLTWGVRQGAKLSTFSFFDDDLTCFNSEAFRAALAERQGNKLVVVLNYPNNPSGYSPTKAEAADMVAALSEAAEAGTKLVVLCDDAYYGMFYEDGLETESLFGHLAQAHENLLAVKIDGATKEEFVWGLRVGFITFGVKNGTRAVYEALEKKSGGAIRGAVSNITALGQSIVGKALADDDFRSQQAEKVQILKERYLEVKKAVYDEQYADCWQAYPFNAGYFMCLRIKDVDAEDLRVHLLEEHGLGTISLGKTDLRVAFSCLEKDIIADAFDRIAQGVRALKS